MSQLCQPNLISLSFPHLHHLVKSNAKQRFALIYAYDPTPSKDTPELPLIPVEPVPEVPEWDPTVTQDGPSSTAACVSSSMSPQPEWFIRAAQGHSLKTIAADQLLEEVTQANEESLKRVGEMVHGTTWNNWEAIRE
jgi:2'-phosphotransferase